MKLTHAVAVLAYIFNQDRILLLKRNHAPRIYAPPGGRLRINEPPLEGLQREVREETGLDSIRIGPVLYVWYGQIHRRSPWLLSAGYLCLIGATPEIRISHEHSNYVWAGLDEIINNQYLTMDGHWGIELSYYQSVFSQYKIYRGNGSFI